MGFRTSAHTYRRDHTALTVGSEGTEILQSQQKLVSRTGAASTIADTDVESSEGGNSWDLVADGDFVVPTNAPAGITSYSIGGASEISGAIYSLDSNNFDIKIEWLDNTGATLYTDQPSAIQSVSDVKFNLIVRSDRAKITISDSSGAAQNRILGSMNAH